MSRTNASKLLEKSPSKINAFYVEFKNHETDMAEKLTKKVVLQDTREKMPIKTPIKTHIKTPIKILKILVLNPNITIPELAQQIDRSESATWRTVRKLQKEGRLKRVGSKKGGYWEVMNNEKGKTICSIVR